MEKLKESLETELKELERIEKAAEMDLKNAPSGTLRIAKSDNREQYYWRTVLLENRSKRYRRKISQEK